MRGVVGGVGVWLLFAGLWLVARGAVGFGDVRFSLPWAMTAAAASWQHLVLAALLGSVFALLFGVLAGPGGASGRSPTPQAWQPDCSQPLCSWPFADESREHAMTGHSCDDHPVAIGSRRITRRPGRG